MFDWGVFGEVCSKKGPKRIFHQLDGGFASVGTLSR
jgi:hypothetical protein